MSSCISSLLPSSGHQCFREVLSWRLYFLCCVSVVPNSPFFHLDFGFYNIWWQKLPQLKKTRGKTAVWKKSFFWHIPHLVPASQLSCDGKFLLQSLLPAVTAHLLSIIPFLLPPPQIIAYLVSLRMLFHRALHASFLHSYFDIPLRWVQEEHSS